jgi:fatty acid desaturase
MMKVPTMSNSSTNLPRERLSQLRERVPDEQQLPTGVKLVAAPLRFVGFWAAIALPFMYMPLLYGGLQASELTVFVALVALNALALVVGHNYARS